MELMLFLFGLVSSLPSRSTDYYVSSDINPVPAGSYEKVNQGRYVVTPNGFTSFQNPQVYTQIQNPYYGKNVYYSSNQETRPNQLYINDSANKNTPEYIYYDNNPNVIYQVDQQPGSPQRTQYYIAPEYNNPLRDEIVERRKLELKDLKDQLVAKRNEYNEEYSIYSQISSYNKEVLYKLQINPNCAVEGGTPQDVVKAQDDLNVMFVQRQNKILKEINELKSKIIQLEFSLKY